MNLEKLIREAVSLPHMKEVIWKEVKFAGEWYFKILPAADPDQVVEYTGSTRPFGHFHITPYLVGTPQLGVLISLRVYGEAPESHSSPLKRYEWVPDILEEISTGSSMWTNTRNSLDTKVRFKTYKQFLFAQQVVEDILTKLHTKDPGEKDGEDPEVFADML